MKKWIYLIFPAVLLVGLFVIYKGHVKQAEEKARIVAAKVAKERAEAEEKKKAAESKARADAKKRQDERDAEEKKKADEKAARQAADDKKVADQTAEFLAKAGAAQKQVTALEAELIVFGKRRTRPPATTSRPPKRWNWPASRAAPQSWRSRGLRR